MDLRSVAAKRSLSCRPIIPRHNLHRVPTRTKRHVASSAVSAAVQDVPGPFVLPSDAPSQLQHRQQHDDPQRRSRFERLRSAKPFSSFLTDSFQRRHTYLRISITERCNLRCTYCMPEAGVPLSPATELLSTPEILLLSELFVSQGVNKIRLTGGEPTIRPDILPLMRGLGGLRRQGLKELCLTTNGVALHRKLEGMVEAGLTGVNLSLDTMNPAMFQIMTRRKGLDAVMRSIQRIEELNRTGAGIRLKINCVVMRGVNDSEMVEFVEMGREKEVEVRFIEYMPFDGNKWSKRKMFSYQEMLGVIRSRYPDIARVEDDKAGETSKTWAVPGFAGRVGFITSMTENFCGTCNRLRITSDGNLKVCLFGNAEVSLRDVIREETSGRPIDQEAWEAMRRRAQASSSSREGANGHGGVLGSAAREAHLLDVIGRAVGGKKEKHAGMDELEGMKNRPMILIDDAISAPAPPMLSSSSGPYWPQVVPSSPPMAPYPSARSGVPLHLLPLPNRQPFHRGPSRTRAFSSSSAASGGEAGRETERPSPPRLPHLTRSSTVHVVPISSKASTERTAVAVGHVAFSNPEPLAAIRAHALRKGDVLAVARVAGIMGAKKTPEFVPLCHSGIGIEAVEVEVEAVGRAQDDEEAAAAATATAPSSSPAEHLELAKKRFLARGIGEHGGARIVATVRCVGKTGVEMEALTAVAAAALTVMDMCKAVDKALSLEGVGLAYKSGGRSGTHRGGGW